MRQVYTPVVLNILILKILTIAALIFFALTGCVTEVASGKGVRVIDKDKAFEQHIKLAQGYVDTSNRESARHHLRKAAEIKKNSPEAAETLARLYQLEGEPTLAEESFKKAIKGKKDFTLAHNNYGAFLFGIKRYEEALAQFEIAAADLDYDRRAAALLNVGKAALALGKTERAKAALQHASILDRNMADAFLELADIYFIEENYAESKQNLDRYHALEKQSARALLLAIRLERIFGNKDKEASYLLNLKNRFPYSREYLEYKRTMM